MIATSKHLVALIALGIVAGCYASNADDSAPAPAEATTLANAGETGMPCDVQQAVAENCWSCHGKKPTKDAMPLVTVDDFSKTDDGKSFAELALARLSDTSKPMPPDGKIADEAKATIETWLRAGAKRGSCSDSASDPLFDVEPTCTSNKFWPKASDHESEYMHPGRACIDCHTKKKEGPSFGIAGTVYPTGHEPDECNGKVPRDLKVQVLDADGKVVAESEVNSAGNFMIERRKLSAIPKDGKVQVVSSSGAVRQMKDTPKKGDCNSCHTQDGAEDAPGRIVVPE